MHPAYSVILFTTASGAGYGLLVWLAALAAVGDIPPDPVLGVVGLGLAFALITAGLLSSTLHLGHPERAWRAFSQWRTSWLSREGVAAVATYGPAGLFAIGWVLVGDTGGAWAVFGVVAAVLALVTVWCTGMIYQSLSTIPAWSEPLVTPNYLALALASGAVLMLALLALFGYAPEAFAPLATVLVALALALKTIYWARIDGRPSTLTAGDATGLGRFGKVRPLEAPHTQPNFVMREMGYQVARKHTLRLRRLVQGAGFGVTLAATLLIPLVPSLLAIVLSGVAVAAMGFAVVVERWLFFAEARHVVMLYYGAEAA